MSSKVSSWVCNLMISKGCKRGISHLTWFISKGSSYAKSMFMVRWKKGVYSGLPIQIICWQEVGDSKMLPSSANLLWSLVSPNPPAHCIWEQKKNMHSFSSRQVPYNTMDMTYHFTITSLIMLYTLWLYHTLTVSSHAYGFTRKQIKKKSRWKCSLKMLSSLKCTWKASISFC